MGSGCGISSPECQEILALLCARLKFVCRPQPNGPGCFSPPGCSCWSLENGCGSPSPPSPSWCCCHPFRWRASAPCGRRPSSALPCCSGEVEDKSGGERRGEEARAGEFPVSGDSRWLASSAPQVLLLTKTHADADFYRADFQMSHGVLGVVQSVFFFVLQNLTTLSSLSEM